MVLRPEPIAAALDALRQPGSTVILLDPGGRVFGHDLAAELAGREHLVIVCPRYEGVDDRVRDLVDLELSIGDYVLSGGEPAAVVVVDAVARLVPGVIDAASTAEESFSHGLLEYPQYTRPPEFDGRPVRQWRLEASLRRTLARRPDLLEGRELSEEERRILDRLRAGE
jgi:tRNA (guanine37-N1)-methyltransferase